MMQQMKITKVHLNPDTVSPYIFILAYQINHYYLLLVQPTIDSSTQDAWNSNLVANVLAEAISNQEILNNKQQTLQTESAESSTQSMTITNKTSKDKPPTPPPQRNETSSNPNAKATTAKPPVTSTAPSTSPFLSTSHEPTTELKEGIEWVSFVYSHHRTLRRYCIRTDLDKVDTSVLDDKFKKENCV